MRSDPEPLWRQAEAAWTDWLAGRGYIVLPAANLESNTPGTRAPMLRVGGKVVRSPDILTVKAGTTEYWEVKTRRRADIDPLTGMAEHWMPFDSFRDYLAASRESGARVWIVLYELASPLAPGRWLRVDLGRVKESGRKGRRPVQGEDLDVWIWPVDAMEIVDGPTVADRRAGRPHRALATLEVDDEHVLDEAHRLDIGRSAVAFGTDRIRAANWEVLDGLMSELGVPARPSYSVLCVNPPATKLEDLFKIPEFGIRLFVISGEPAPRISPRLEALRDARLFEWAHVPGIPDATLWAVDGRHMSGQEAALEGVLTRAAAGSDLNVMQYRIVHEKPGRDVLVTAGAGTGKTETMVERIIFLLATVGSESRDPDQSPVGLRADEIALITFTREAASQMRSRLYRAISLRQRLSSKSVLPTVAWLMQLGNAQISTIHAFARDLLERSGASVGYAPGFHVSNRSMALRALIDKTVSPAIVNQYADTSLKNAPAAHEWASHVKAVWDAVSNYGVDLLQGEAAVGYRGNLSTQGSQGSDARIANDTGEALLTLEREFRDACVRAQEVPPGRLVALALEALSASRTRLPTAPRFLFVDEFQDTDRTQMKLFHVLRERCGTRLFAVGDAKQGVYRFRGAAGDAFELLRAVFGKDGVTELVAHSLSVNYRSGAELLDSLHPIFSNWADEDLLVYTDMDRLVPASTSGRQSARVETRRWSKREALPCAALTVFEWHNASPQASIGILSRVNRHAIELQRYLRSEFGLPCEIRIGGAFYRTPAVREMRVLLEAVADPEDEAALLELCETRWAGVLLGAGCPDPRLYDSWGGEHLRVFRWTSRLSGLASEGSATRGDLEKLRRRVRALGGLLATMPTLSWLVGCIRMLNPESCALPGDLEDRSDLLRYKRCLDQLVTRLDSTFADSPTSLQTLLGWLSTQIATNRNEDEEVSASVESGSGKIVSLTAHKAKGLEFDYVLIPYTWTPFDPPKTEKTLVAIASTPEGAPEYEVAWRWRPGRMDRELSNSVPQSVWSSDEHETRKEEARLLYVAMTRARERLVVNLSHAGSAGRPNSWADLLALGGLNG